MNLSVNDDLLRALCALAAFLLPMGLAWATVAWQARRRRPRVRRERQDGR
jgi:hypothetical protein